MQHDYLIIGQPGRTMRLRRYRYVKRTADLVFILMTLPVLIPLASLLALVIRLDSPGPVLFTQDRVGKGGTIFRMYKFRTMRHNLDNSSHQTYMKAYVSGKTSEAGSNSQTYKPPIRKDITRVGRVLRKWSLDELPQVLNVLKGEMSLVGPRPNVPWEVDEYNLWHHERLEVLPGMTGLAQVRGRSKISFTKIVEYDIEYARHWSPWMDLKILWWTMWTVLVGTGAE